MKISGLIGVVCMIVSGGMTTIAQPPHCGKMVSIKKFYLFYDENPYKSDASLKDISPAFSEVDSFANDRLVQKKEVRSNSNDRKITYFYNKKGLLVKEMSNWPHDMRWDSIVYQYDAQNRMTRRYVYAEDMPMENKYAYNGGTRYESVYVGPGKPLVYTRIKDPKNADTTIDTFTDTNGKPGKIIRITDKYGNEVYFSSSASTLVYQNVYDACGNLIIKRTVDNGKVLFVETWEIKYEP
ncbi:hypothetical protein [Hufsiella ginkgonis]|uniref:Uncharacterized protein n=1 Tax=Hufsiella ginkgonis TaxID=2695274 RepID=A0A7K1XUN8_9SPHI|nr:hypothetical protein [Hufsiella ginkgonis]MXV14723.1 hypothetical protein [Hufsiella ginkgonis]